MMSKLIRVNGNKGDVYFIEIFPSEALADIKQLLFKKYKQVFTDFKIGEQPIDNTDMDKKISELPNFNNETIYSLNASVSQSDQIPEKIVAPPKKDEKLDKNMENLLDNFTCNIGLTVKKEKIIEVLRSDFSSALGTDPDNKERIKAIEYLIQSEGTCINIDKYDKKTQKALNIMSEKLDLPISLVGYVYFGNNKDKKETMKRLKRFLSK